MMLILLFIISGLRAESTHPVFTSANKACQLFYQKEVSQYELVCLKNRSSFKLTPTADLADQYQQLEKNMSQYSDDVNSDQVQLKKIILAHFEEKFRFEYPGDEALLTPALKSLSQLPDQLGSVEECLDSEKELTVTPFIDLRFDPESQLKIERELVDQKMASEGFLKLGKLQDISLEFGTKNDNFFHGIGRQFIENEQDLPWWEGDDRGYTFGLNWSAEMNYEKGGLKLSQYTDAYSELARVNNKIRDEENRRYQNLVTVDGLLFEVRVNQTNGDKYFKVIGSVERLTDSGGLAPKIQDKWHEWGGAIQYHNLPHRNNETRLQTGLAVGMEKSSTPLTWLGVKYAIEGKVQGSTAGMENSFVGLSTEVAVNTNQLFRSQAGSPPVLEARLKADHKHYGDNKSYTNIGVTLYGTVYSDKKGNVLKVFAGVDQHKDPLTRRYAHAEDDNRNRADLIHTLGIKYERKF